MERVHELLAAAKVAAGLTAAVEEGLLDAVAERAPAAAAEEIAQALGLAPAPVRALLRVLADEGVVAEVDGGWQVTPAAQVLLRSHPHGLRPLVELEAWASRSHLNPAGIRAALHGRRRRTEVPDEMVPVLARAMLVGSRRPALLIARRRELHGVRRLLDVGGGSGGYAVALCRTHPQLEVDLLDRAVMLAEAEPVVRAGGASARVRLRAWDLHRDPLPAGADAALVSHVLHLLDAGSRRNLLDRVALALPPGGLLIIHDFFDGRTIGAIGSAARVDWLSIGAAFDLHPAELAEELADAGFAAEAEVPLPAVGTALILARRTSGPHRQAPADEPQSASPARGEAPTRPRT